MYIHTYIYIYTYMYASGASRDTSSNMKCNTSPPQGVHPVSITRFPSFRTQPLKNITPLPMNKWVPEQPSPWRKS